MAKAERRAKSQKNAAELIKKGYPHGRRASKPSHNNFPVNQAGSAAYRRLMASKMKRNQHAPEPVYGTKVTKSANRRGKDYQKAA